MAVVLSDFLIHHRSVVSHFTHYRGFCPLVSVLASLPWWPHCSTLLAMQIGWIWEIGRRRFRIGNWVWGEFSCSRHKAQLDRSHVVMSFQHYGHLQCKYDWVNFSNDKGRSKDKEREGKERQVDSITGITRLLPGRSRAVGITIDRRTTRLGQLFT